MKLVVFLQNLPFYEQREHCPEIADLAINFVSLIDYDTALWLQLVPANTFTS